MSSVFAILFLFGYFTSIATSEHIKKISTFVPSCGPLNGATSVLMKGEGFLPNDQIKFGGIALSEPHVQFKSAEEIMLFISGAYATVSKNFTVEVVSNDGKKKSNIKYFYVYDTPDYIEEIQPKIGWEGDTMTAKGRFLDCGAVKCRFGAVQMTVDAFYVSGVEVKCKVPRLDIHGVSSIYQNRTSNGLTQKDLKNEASNSSQSDAVLKVDSPPDPDKAKKFTISSDGQHFDSIPDNIVFTFRDPVKYVIAWIWLAWFLGFGALFWIVCIVSCCCYGYEAIKKKLSCCKRFLKNRKGYEKM